MSFSSAFSHSRMTLLRSASNSIGPWALGSHNHMHAVRSDKSRTQNNP